MMNGLQTVENWQEYFNRPKGSLLGIFNAIQSIGGIAGLPFSAFVADKFGRRKAIFFGSCCESLCFILLPREAFVSGVSRRSMCFISLPLEAFASAVFHIASVTRSLPLNEGLCYSDVGGNSPSDRR